MRKRMLIALAVSALLALAFLAGQGTGAMAVAGPIESVGNLGPAADTPAQETTCNSCSDCSTKLASGSYLTVTLAVDLQNVGGTCISLILGESGVAFDCDGHTIDGDEGGVDLVSGIAMFHGTNNKILNCTISDFDRGIYLSDATDHTVHNNDVTSNGTGIEISHGGSHNVRYNTIDANTIGIYLSNTTNNAIYNNIVCDNVNLDFNLSGGSGNSGDANTCDKPDGWNDQGETGCTNLCSGSAQCDSCASCTSSLTGTFDRVVLTADISNHAAGHCITFGANNVEFNCGGHTIDGAGFNYGVYVANYDGNSVRDCTIRDFQRGITLNNSDDSTVDQNTIEENTYEGIYLFSTSSGNTITFNDIRSNGAGGIGLDGAPSNTIEYNTIEENSGPGIYLDASSSTNTIHSNKLNNNSTSGLALSDSPGNNVYANEVRCNNQGIQLDNADNTTVNGNTVCSNPGPDFDVSGDTTGHTGENNRCDAPNGWDDDGTSGCTFLCNSDRCNTCSDGVRNGSEEGVDCGGDYCPPCSQCSGEPTTKWAPPDTGCNNDWPTSEGPTVGINTTMDSCAMFEVCNPDLDYIVADALACCEHPDYEEQFAGTPRAEQKNHACNWGHLQAYNHDFAFFNPGSMKTCMAYYVASSLGYAGVYMQGYFHGEWCCYGSDICAGGCSYWNVNPAAWDMGTTESCAHPDGRGYRPDFDMDGHSCTYRDAWIFGTYGEHGWWDSDSNYRDNNDSAADLPAHASLNKLSTGSCVDYAIAYATIMRKAGYAYEDVMAVDGDGHDYNLIRFPVDAKWHYVDTTGNRGGEVHGGPGHPDPTDPDERGHPYCTSLDEGCYNDVLSVSRSHCPENEVIFGCEEVVRSQSVPTPPASFRTKWAQSRSPLGRSKGTDQTCTELNPCEVTAEQEVQPSGPLYQIEVHKAVDRAEIVLGERLEITIEITNNETKPIDVAVQEEFIPNVAYDLPAEETWYESLRLLSHSWTLSLPANDTTTLTFTVVPSDVGSYAFKATAVFTDGHGYWSNVPTVTVACSPNGTCDPGETYRYCSDCDSGIADGYCDMADDGRIDPDCQYAWDPDYNPSADTDADGVLDSSDKCPLTPVGAFVDAAGCACIQKTCADQNPNTVDRCNPTTVACEHIADSDGDDVADGEDNCPDEYNPEQYDTDSDNIGDQCEIPPITADTTLDGGTYYVRDLGLEGAVVISASNVTLDCNGATLIGIDGGAGYGIYVPESVSDVTVQNCTVQGYRYGIYVDSSSGNQLLDNTVQTNAFGIILGAASGSTISGNTASGNTQAGIYLEGCTQGQVNDNTVNNNGTVGLFIHTSSGNDISNNTVCGNSEADFTVYDSTNTGDDNVCDNADGWDDEGTTGCTNACALQQYYIYLPLIVRN